MKKPHYFIGTKKSPYHLSVGAVVMNRKGQIYCHHFPKGKRNPDFFILMRETINPGEALEKALARGLKEEFGMKTRILTYLGSIESKFTNWEKTSVRKTTLYFLCAPVKQMTRWITSPETRKGHFGAGSDLEWRSPKFLITQMKKQDKKMRRNDFDESNIIERAIMLRKK